MYYKFQPNCRFFSMYYMDNMGYALIPQGVYSFLLNNETDLSRPGDLKDALLVSL